MNKIVSQRKEGSQQTSFIHTDMLLHNTKIAGRYLWKHRAYSGINLMGLLLGMVCSLLIGLWVQDEWQKDRFHTQEDQLYRVLLNQYADNQTTTTVELPGPVAPYLKTNYPSITHFARLSLKNEDFLLSAGSKNIKVKARYVGGDFFSMLSFPLVDGDPETALSTPDGLVISASLARNLFGTEQATGRVFKLNNQKDYKVKAVMADMDIRSSYRFDLALPFELFEKRVAWAKTWDNNFFWTFIKLTPDADPGLVGKTIKNVVNQHLTGHTAATHSDLILQPYADMYLYNRFLNGAVDGGRIEYVRLLAIIGVLVLFIACINYTNLATARYMKRYREVGVRKVMGATRKVLAGQFLAEAFLLIGLAVLLVLPIAYLLLPVFNNWTGKQIVVPYDQLYFWKFFIGLVFLTTFLSGGYPALFLSRLSAVKLLKGNVQGGAGNIFARQGLVIAQFAISTVLIAGTLVIARQIHFIKNKNLGYNRHQLILIPTEGGLDGKYGVIREKLLHMPGVNTVSLLGRNPISVDFSTTNVDWDGKPKGANIPFTGMWVDTDFAKTMQISLKQGRFFSADFTRDASYVINETAAKAMGMTNPIGKKLDFWRGRGEIIGVIKDYHMNTIHEPILPLILAYNDRWGTDIMVRTAENSPVQPMLQQLGQLFKEFNPQYPFEYHFLDETFETQYRSETLIGQLMNVFAGLAIFISCLGLLGLAAFTAEQRTKEIGIRKVLGASVAGLARLLCRDFLKLVFIAIAVALPVAWYAMDEWLAGFAYRIDMSWWMPATAGLLVIMIALLTVSFQAIRAAIANPVKSLRSE